MGMCCEKKIMHDWVNKCVEYEVQEEDHRGHGEKFPKRIVKHVN